ncbi:MAG: YraN family protein [Oligoflexia bacterium]|nr:YraN family protein [Oligoflexia bacterium]
MGHRIERLAEEYLLTEVSRICVARNFRCKSGEIDLVLEETLAGGRTELVFVEVRCRREGSWVGGIESVTFPKRQRLKRAIAQFLCQYRGGAASVRVDILGWDGRSWETARNVWL